VNNVVMYVNYWASGQKYWGGLNPSGPTNLVPMAFIS